MTTTELPLASIIERNYREAPQDVIRALAAAIAADGHMHDPVRVWEDSGVFVLLAGHHRCAAARLLGWESVPAQVVPRPVDDAAHLMASVADNATHRQAHAWEEGAAFVTLLGEGYSVADIALRCAKSTGWVENRLDLMALTESIRPVVAARGFVWARALADLSPAAQRACVRQLTDETTRGQWSAICQRARDAELEAASQSLFDPAAFTLTTQEWDAALSSYTDPTVYESDEDASGDPVPLGLAEIAQRLGVARGTAHKWQARGLLPEPWATVSGVPVWKSGTIAAWAAATGRA